MKVIKEPLKGLLVIRPKVFKDERGFFLETWQKQKYKALGIKEEFVQDNWSRSSKGVLRGIHFQKKRPQGKLVSVKTGSVFDVAVDIKKGSPTFGQWFGIELNEQNHLQLYVPPGFAHGFKVLSDTTDFVYKCTDYYDPSDEGGIIWNDPNINILWPQGQPIISSKDSQLKQFSEIF